MESDDVAVGLDDVAVESDDFVVEKDEVPVESYGVVKSKWPPSFESEWLRRRLRKLWTQMRWLLRDEKLPGRQLRHLWSKPRWMWRRMLEMGGVRCINGPVTGSASYCPAEPPVAGVVQPWFAWYWVLLCCGVCLRRPSYGAGSFGKVFPRGDFPHLAFPTRQVYGCSKCSSRGARSGPSRDGSRPAAYLGTA